MPSRKKLFWHGRKAMAAYTLTGLVVGVVGLLLVLLDRNQDSDREAVIVRATAEELREVNDVRPLVHEEQAISIDRVAGVHAVALARVLESNARHPLMGLLNGVTLQRDIKHWRGAVEVHKTDEGRVMIVGYVDSGTVARLGDTSRPVGNLFLHHEAEREGQFAVAIPVSRIADWDYRDLNEFSEIEVD